MAQHDAPAENHVPSGAEAGADAPEAECPNQLDDPTPKVRFREYLAASPERVTDVTIWLRANPLPPLPDCAGSSDRSIRCTARDDALAKRQLANANHINCVLAAIDGFRLTPLPVWYEEPYHLTDGRPAPILLAFRVGIDASQIERAATSPLVSAIDPSPGTAFATGFVPPMPDGCPPDSESNEAADAKVTGISGIVGAGRRPVMVEVMDDGVLPPSVMCDGSADCSAAVASLWDRTILNTRQMTCIKRRLDHLVADSPPRVPAGTAVVNLAGALLPPLGQATGTVKAFGWGLTFDEALALAKDPNVERIWTSPALQFEPETPGCPPDVSRPIPMTACPSGTTSIADKISGITAAAFLSAGDVPKTVWIMVAGGAHLCPLDACSQRPCPARDAILKYWEDQNRESQHCVRALIDEVGGSSNSEVFYIANSFSATLTWSQLQVVAAHPHVTSISVDESGGPLQVPLLAH